MAPEPPKPLIPEKYLDVPAQRLYCLSIGLLCQAVKLFDFFQYLFAEEDATTNYRNKWLFFDFAFCVSLSILRIPRLNYSKSMLLLQIASFWCLDGLLFGGINLAISRGRAAIDPSHQFSDRLNFPSTPEPFSFSSLIDSLSFGLISPGTYGTKDANLLGQHTIRMSPISTAHLNPHGHTFCLSSSESAIFIPILLNNTRPISVKYSLAPPGYSEDEANGKIQYFDLNAKDLKAIEQSRIDELPVRVVVPDDQDSDEYDEYDDDDENDTAGQNNYFSLQKTQSLAHIRITKPGTLRLKRVLEMSNVESRIGYPSEVTVVPCPRVQFVEDVALAGEQDMRCAKRNSNLELMIDMHGVPPLTLRWSKIVNGKREDFSVDGIEPGHDHSEHSSHGVPAAPRRGRTSVVHNLKIPLAVSLESPGTHMYALEEIIDGLGNIVHVGSDLYPLTFLDTRKNGLGRKPGPLNPKLTHSLVVLRRPTVSFKYCGPGSPTRLLIGSEAPLTISAHDSDTLDTPWEVVLKYQPMDGDGGKRFKPWKKTLKTLPDNNELTVRASAPGEYTILSVKGKYCDGDVLAHETCKVVEEPLPTAQIEWKRIHECSGDTGVLASLILHGTPPFVVYYRTQQDKEPARELSKTFPGSRGELSLQPERSGHYSYSFFQISDANYKKVELQGPSIDQVVHPLAAAEFTSGQAGSMRNKRVLSSCSGDTVDVDVDLRGTGPWNLEVQVVGPKSLETLQFRGITKSLERLQIPIPKIVDKDGGTFDIDLTSIEDVYGCKRSISGPGISANVRRVKPTAKFYGDDRQRFISVLEGEQANLPLRLTGHGPWRIKYSRSDASDRIFEAALNTPNDQLRVTGKGVYEIVHVMDSQCPGSVITDASTYTVDWIPRPSAKLSSQTKAIHEPYNSSNILPPICEGTDDHVDLELTGKPPFQIMYNVAQDSETGGTKLLDQPTFSSIQPRTRFQLHTSSPGRMYYEVKQIGDAAYPLAKHGGAVIPRAERLLFEQAVLMRPTARFKGQNRLSYCLRDFFVPRDYSLLDGVVELEGTPPFVLQISVKNPSASHVDTQIVELSEKVWKIDLPTYAFKSIGPHLVTIESVQDASHCVQAPPDPLYRSMWVDVAEAAAIVAFDRREHYCVGDVSQFQLEGTPPWTVGYRINNKPFLQEAKTSPFSLLQQQPGEFTITSIAHQRKMCKAAVTDLRFIVHPLPSALVANGKRVIQDIHEGDQAEILFTLVGEPPFTFTYQRSEPSARQGGKTGRVLETHTVSGVTTKEYSIYSSLEGTWTVTSISDRYCRYPPSQPNGMAEKQRF